MATMVAAEVVDHARVETPAMLRVNVRPVFLPVTVKNAVRMVVVEAAVVARGTKSAKAVSARCRQIHVAASRLKDAATAMSLPTAMTAS